MIGDRLPPAWHFLLNSLRSKAGSPWASKDPIRAELFGVERLEAHARSLATVQTVFPGQTRGYGLASRLAENEPFLAEAFRSASDAAMSGVSITPAARWLIDNYHLVERQIRQVRVDLPPGYYRQLPKLMVGPFAGYARVFEVAWAYVAHTDSLFDPEIFRRFVAAYQSIQVLTIGELWASAITLRLVLVENLRRIAASIAESQASRRDADEFADRLLGLDAMALQPMATILASRGGERLSPAFVTQFLRRMREQSAEAAPALTWLDARLAEDETTTQLAVAAEHEGQVAATITVKNIITSMRLISEIDWLQLFERMSRVDEVLSAAGPFQDMDFQTRNLYRTAIEELARGARLGEIEVAALAVDAAARTREVDDDIEHRRADPGYFLIAAGRAELEAAIGYQPPMRLWAHRISLALGIGGYGSFVVLTAALVLSLPILAVASMGLGSRWTIVLAVLGWVPALDTAVAIVNSSVSRITRTETLPALALRDGVPVDFCTMVAVPVLLTSARVVEGLLETLETHHLASLDGHVYFALLSDWSDAAAANVDGDADLFVMAAEGVSRLNAKYGPAPAGDRFLLLHRKRVWSESEQQWIGWERKRGKLHELNRLLRGAQDTNFITIAGGPPIIPANVRFVITLDADTRLPLDTVRRLIGKLAHPLNRPRFDRASGRVVEGFGVLQPRITPSLSLTRAGSMFQRVFAGASGIDPYAAAVSDVYQDLFGEGSYAGKGIYDIDAFEASLAERVPDSTLLSHDLFEGVFARAGLASDVEVVEEFPERYEVAALRNHRWARGDWQLLPWILAIVGNHKSVPATGRWKMIDNLRRSLTAPVGVLALVVGWMLPPTIALLWTIFVIAALSAPALAPFFESLAGHPEGITRRGRLMALRDDLRLALARLAFTTIFLAHQAWLMGDAIIRTLVRLLLTRRHLLQWVPAAQLAAGAKPGLVGYFRLMAGAVVIAGAAVLVAWLSGSGSWPLAVGFAGLWIASPFVALQVSRRPPLPQRLAVTSGDAQTMRLIARLTWRYFETFVTAADNMLPPDNFQETPHPTLARRTSPTNMGLYLLSVASARDFGWIGTLEAVERLEGTLATMARLERFRGHFYNWYDTDDLRALDPQYVSTVDSGNLAGHLITLANACSEWARHSSVTEKVRLEGAQDAHRLASKSIEQLKQLRGTPSTSGRDLDTAMNALSAALASGGIVGDAGLAFLATLAENVACGAARLAAETASDAADDAMFWTAAVAATIASHRRDDVSVALPGPTLASRLQTLADTARAMALAMDFRFLFDNDRKLLSIGYAVQERLRDTNCYDLLASEARLASFFAIAKGDLPARHWFRLSHAVTLVGGRPALISWSGSMFEYLMPLLVMREPMASLLEQTEYGVVQHQIAYGRQHGLPWGVSESAYNVRDLEFTYQYSNFGVPGLGLKRDLGENLVVAPYATALAAMIEPRSAVENFARLAVSGAVGRQGYYEALDYTPGRVREGENVAVVHSYMAHHQGMTIVALANTLLAGAMRTRFHAEPMVLAAELLLQERMPRFAAAALPTSIGTGKLASTTLGVAPGAGWQPGSPQASIPSTCLLSNGRYSIMLTSAGSGYSRWSDIAVTRWRDDATCDELGSHIFVRDVGSNKIWSAGFQPTELKPDRYGVTFHEDRAEFSRTDGDLTTSMTVLVSAEDDAEVRRVSVFNSGTKVREIEVTSYAELVLAPVAADTAHPAFSKLFVETERLESSGAVLAWRRRRDPHDAEVWAAHLTVVDDGTVGLTEFETDRAQFLGRDGSLRAPRAIVAGRPLSGASGPVLDPVFALRVRLRIAPGATVNVAFWTMVASSRPAILDLIDKHHEKASFERAATLAWTLAGVQLHHVGLDNPGAARLQRLARHLIYASPEMRSTSAEIEAGAASQSDLWTLGISGDLPIILLRIAETDNLSVASDILQAVDYWRMKRLAFDLVILNERRSSYVQDLQNALEGLVRSSQSRAQSGIRPAGAVFVLRADLIAPATRALLLSIARVDLAAADGELADQIDNMKVADSAMTASAPRVTGSIAPVSRRPELEFDNGVGGFCNDGREYVVIMGPDQNTPAPWINVIANPHFGFQVSATGAGYTWSQNSKERQLTPWSNDPVLDPPGQVFYVRDQSTGAVFSPTASPIRDASGVYTARHGRGFSQFDYCVDDLELGLLEYVPCDDPIKISRLTIHNRSQRSRQLSVAAYVEWVLGATRDGAAPFTTTAIDGKTGAMFARNRWSASYAERVAFIDLGGRQTSWTGDRREFIGRNGSLENPMALSGSIPLTGRVGAGLDPCGAMLTQVELPVNGSVEIVFLLGEAADAQAARDLINYYRSADLDAVLASVRRQWDDVLGAISVTTPDRSLDIMLNGWLLYQTLACRVWARSAFYQASGAYGFRDQLQDVMALTASRPAIAREQILRAAGRQFEEGDVQHWWLPGAGNGIRTRFSDDRIWLPYVAANYVKVTDDSGILDSETPFLKGPVLATGQAENFFQPGTSALSASLFEHCARALDASLDVGGHGLPLIGGGDWNDGFNRVGADGKGESVWLGWFLHATLSAFIPIAQSRGEQSRAAAWTAHAAALSAALASEAWDGEWYRRGWFDDGTPLGSSTSTECRIDAIAQSWAAISGADDPQRATRAMAAVERQLIMPESGLALLFAPPFDKSEHDPGYIMGYPPGIRENGGQYTHGALWSVFAFAALKEGEKAAALLAQLNPINHSRTPTEAHRYKVEPYVVAADIYSMPPHVGRGGWTWYTGAAGWMQRAGIEAVLGLRIEGNIIHLDPCIPRHWAGFKITLRHRSDQYEIIVDNPDCVCGGAVSVDYDGVAIEERPLRLALKGDGGTHVIHVKLG